MALHALVDEQGFQNVSVLEDLGDMENPEEISAPLGGGRDLERIPGVLLSELELHADQRGSFVEILRSSAYPRPFVQSNHSRSKKGVLRGLHYHRKQADLWYVVSGLAQVALADLRSRGQPRVEVVVLSGQKPATLYIPPGVAHGFLALTDLDIIYWVTHEHNTEDEFGVAWDDPTLAVPWHARNPILSSRDQQNEELRWELIPRF